MITIETHHMNVQKWRSRVFTFLTVFLSIALLIAGTFEFIPAWILKDPADSIHLWHIAELTAIAILLGGVMFGLVRKPAEEASPGTIYRNEYDNLSSRYRALFDTSSWIIAPRRAACADLS